jgi:predicted aspartyl protease
VTSIGRVTGDREAVVPLLVRAQNNAGRQVDALLDTGFNGYLALPLPVIDALDLLPLGREQVTLASGETQLIRKFEGEVRFASTARSVEIVQAGEPLARMALLWGFDLRIECVGGRAGRH